MGGSFLNGFLLDTHIWYWYLSGSDRLPPEARALLDQRPKDLYLSPISIWETGILYKKGQIQIDEPFSDWLRDARAEFPLREAPLNQEVARLSLEVELPHKDPADRFLAATAQVYEVFLITADRKLLDSPSIPTLALR